MTTIEPTRPSAGQRIGDAERQSCAERLSQHHAHGRLSDEEFEVRLGAALTAQHDGELGRLLIDLPIIATTDVERSPTSTPGAELPAPIQRVPWRIVASGGVSGAVALFGMYLLSETAFQGAMITRDFLQSSIPAVVALVALVAWVAGYVTPRWTQRHRRE